MSSYSFNVAFEPWIPVRLGEQLELLSLEQTLLRAREIERIEDASPLVTTSLHRLLLAVLHRALGGPEDVSACAQWINKGAFPDKAITGYLHKWSDKGRFDLFAEKCPFYQVGGYENKLKSVANLAAELASGTNKLLFDHTFESKPPALSPAEAAQLLVARQMMAIPEGAGYSPSPIGGAAAVLPLGETLLETLCLNLVPYIPTPEDTPVWENEVPRPDAEQMILGLTQRYTWMSRLVRLIPETIEDVEDTARTVVTKLHYGPACKPLAGDSHDPDPMLAYYLTKATTVLRAVSFRKDRVFWRDFTALLPHSGSYAPQVINHALEVLDELEVERALPTMVMGATNDKAKFEFWRTERYTLPAKLTARQTSYAYSALERALKESEEIGTDLGRAAYSLAKNLLSHSEREPDRNDISKLANSFPTYQVYWSGLSKAFPGFLKQLDSATPKEAELFWTRELFHALTHTWALTRKAAGDNAFALRAIYSAERVLVPVRQQLYERINPRKEVV